MADLRRLEMTDNALFLHRLCGTHLNATHRFPIWRIFAGILRVHSGRTSKLADCVVTFHSLRHLASGTIVLEKGNKAILFLDTGVGCLAASGNRAPPGGLARKCRQAGLV